MANDVKSQEPGQLVLSPEKEIEPAFASGENLNLSIHRQRALLLRRIARFGKESLGEFSCLFYFFFFSFCIVLPCKTSIVIGRQEVVCSDHRYLRVSQLGRALASIGSLRKKNCQLGSHSVIRG